MRLWHYKLISLLPKSQLLAQWRELNSIFKKQDRHILINYVYDYPKDCLQVYADMVINEMDMRGYKVKSMDNYHSYFKSNFPILPLREKSYQNPNPFENDHDDEYLVICYFNLLEKYVRGQKDFDGELMYHLSCYCEPILEQCRTFKDTDEGGILL